jgi:glycosyltransferase involved in cell wall biosynthesis
MTVYNDLRFLDEAVESVLQQEFRDFELIIVDDGTGRDAVFEALKRRDSRIRILVNRMNPGTAAANRGIEASVADIIVRLDADDLAEPTRLTKLVAVLGEDPELGLVGSCCTLIDETGQAFRTAQMPLTDLEIRWLCISMPAAAPAG